MTRALFPKPLFLPVTTKSGWPSCTPNLSHAGVLPLLSLQQPPWRGAQELPSPRSSLYTYFHKIYGAQVWARAGYFTLLLPHDSTSCLDHVSASAKVRAAREEAELGAGPQQGDAVVRQQNWASRTPSGFGQGYWSWFAPKPQVERQQEGKELIWKSFWILHLHLMLNRMGLDGENDYVYSTCLHRDTLFLGNIQCMMPPKSTWHLESCEAGLTLSCSCARWTPVFV